MDCRLAAAPSSNGLLFAAFIHPLASLDPELARSALDQVAALVHTFGGQFSSGHLKLVTALGNTGAADDDDDDGEGGETLLN